MWGAALAVFGLLLLGRVEGSLLSSGVLWIATPGAHVVSWISGWPLQQEASLACYAVRIFATTALAGALMGGVGAVLAARR